MRDGSLSRGVAHIGKMRYGRDGLIHPLARVIWAAIRNGQGHIALPAALSAKAMAHQ